MITTQESAVAVQAVLAFPLLMMGLSHLLQPKMWIGFFSYLHGLGYNGVLIRTFALELVPAVAIITFHMVWTGPETVITLYGILLAIKILLSLVIPSIGLRSLAMADLNKSVNFILAGTVLIAVSGICFWSVLV
ncbi:MAG: hypothetical protein AAF541_12270 [Pseudomonadota bacterium]